MKEQLDRAYNFLRTGQTTEGLAILESLIRENPENEDAWWLFANGTNEIAAKRNALNQVLRLSQNAERKAKAAELLQALDRDPYSFDKPSENLARPLQANNGFGRFVLLGIGALGLLACIACALLSNFALPYFQMPATVEDMGELSAGTVTQSALDSDKSQVYQLALEANQHIRITITAGTESDTSPYLFLFTTDGQIVAFNSELHGNYNRLEEVIPTGGNYLLVVRPFLGVGGGDYSLEFEIVE